MRKCRVSNHLNKKSLWGILFVSPAIFGTTVFTFVPFVISIYFSLLDGVATQNFIGLSNYRQIFTNGTFQMSLWNTCRFAAIAIPILNLFAMILALLLTRCKSSLRDSFRSAFIFPLVLPVASVSLFFQIFFSETGWINSVIEDMGLLGYDFFYSEKSFWLLVALYVWKNCGYNMILYVAMFESIPKEYYEEAELQGANVLTRMIYITFPISVPYLFFIGIISFVNTFKSFREAYILFGSYPHNSIYMLQHFLNNNFQSIDYIQISTGSIIVFGFVFVFVGGVFLLQKRWNERI